MKIGVLTFKSPVAEEVQLESENMLEEAIRTMGHEYRLIYATDVQLYFGVKHRPLLRNRPFPKLDALIVRPSFINLFSVKATFIKHFQFTNIAVLNDYMPVLAAKNRMRTLQVLKYHKVPVPKSLVVKSTDDLEDTAKRLGTYPLLVKKVTGSGLVLVESRRSLHSISSTMLADLDQPLIVQEYFPEAKGRDLQLIVVGEKVLAAVERRQKKGEYRSDLSLGGKVRVASISAREKRIAVDAAHALRLDVAGVDIIRTKRGPRVLQVSSNPDLAAIKGTTGIDVAPEIVKHAVVRVRSRRKRRIDVIRH